MASQLIDQLRRTIDAKHSEAIKALGTLAAYLEESTPKTSGGQKGLKKQPPRAGTGKIRNAVLALLQKDFLSIQAVAQQTGYKVGQVRGVVSAPALKGKVSKKEVDGVMCYKFDGEEEE